MKPLHYTAVMPTNISQPPLPGGSPRAYWLCQIAGWYGIAILQFGVLFTLITVGRASAPTAEEMAVIELLQTILHGVSLWQAAAELLALYTVALLLSHLLHGYIKQWRWATLSAWAKTPRVMLAGFLLSAPLGLTQQFTSLAFLHPSAPGAPWVQQLQQAIQWAPYFWSWMIAYFIILNQRRLRVAELQRSELTRGLQLAELRLLKSQLNPHFLFNSLNSVRALIADDPRRAQDAVTQLARTLRYTLASGQEELVTLAQELEIVGDYLDLESLRLGERLKITRDISYEAMRARIPVMLLQTVVENAIKHGIAELPEGGVLRLSANVLDGALLIEVENPRPANPMPSAHEGIGLRNGAERLRLLFGADASLDLDLSDPARAIARVRIPADVGLKADLPASA